MFRTMMLLAWRISSGRDGSWIPGRERSIRRRVTLLTFDHQLGHEVDVPPTANTTRRLSPTTAHSGFHDGRLRSSSRSRERCDGDEPGSRRLGGRGAGTPGTLRRAPATRRGEHGEHGEDRTRRRARRRTERGEAVAWGMGGPRIATGFGARGMAGSEHTFQGSAPIDDPDGKGLRNRACPRARSVASRGLANREGCAVPLVERAAAVLDVWRLRDRSGAPKTISAVGAVGYESVSKGVP